MLTNFADQFRLVYCKSPSPNRIGAVRMPIVEYRPELFEPLQRLVSQFPGPLNLSHRPFVDHYYATSNWCKLYLYLSDSGEIIGTLGRELARFVYHSREITIRIASNWYSLQPGVGSQLSQYSAQANPGSIALTLGGSRDTLAILRHRNWTFIPGIRGYCLNKPYSLNPGDSWWRRASKSVARHFFRKRIASLAARIPAHISAKISVCEEKQYSDDLLPASSPFAFRFTPSVEYLSWRYGLSLSFVHYRVFRVMVRGKSAGYVILQDSPQRILVAQCDGTDPSHLAYGVLLCVLEVARSDAEPRTVLLACCHSEMQTIFQKFGFRHQLGDLPFALRTPLPGLDTTPDTAYWLVNFDWGDNGMRQPFADPDGRVPGG